MCSYYFANGEMSAVKSYYDFLPSLCVPSQNNFSDLRLFLIHARKGVWGSRELVLPLIVYEEQIYY